MKSHELTIKSKRQHYDKNTQTDFSVLNYELLIRLKDKQIQQLQKKLQKFKSPHAKLTVSAEKSLETSIESFQLSPRIRHHNFFPSEDFDVSSQAIKSLSTKVPLDTAIIEEIDKLTPGNYNNNKTKEDLGAYSKLLKKAQKKKPLPPMNGNTNSKSSLVRQSKESLKIKPKIKQINVISELLYKEDQDKDSWNFVLNKFREDPQLLSQALQDMRVKEDKKIRCSVSTEPIVRNRVNSVYKNRKYSQEPVQEFRPISAGVSKTAKAHRPITGRNKDIDWSKSVLDSLVGQKKTEFYYLDPTMFTSLEVEELMVNKTYSNLDFLYDKSIKTLERLKTEMLIPKNYMVIPQKSKENLEQILLNCFQLFRARLMIIKVLQLIHIREDCLLRLMANDENIEKLYKNLIRLGKKILHIIMYLKCTKFPIGTFVYLGEDYAEKIQKDLKKILSVYPDLKNSDLDEVLSQFSPAQGSYYSEMPKNPIF